jgi:hypothetical protein
VSEWRRVLTSVTLALAALVSVPASASAREGPVVPGVRSITLTTASKGLGAHPTLRWKPARGVTTYAVFVQSTKGQPYWSWRGAETRVRLGGGDANAVARSEGASLSRPRVWFVLGLDGSGAVVAASTRQRLEP